MQTDQQSVRVRLLPETRTQTVVWGPQATQSRDPDDPGSSAARWTSQLTSN